MTDYNEELETSEAQDETDVSVDEDIDLSDDSEEADEPDYKSLYEEVKIKYEKARADKNGLIKKVENLSKKFPTKVEATPVVDETRLDVLELRMVDKELTKEMIDNALLIKKSKGLDSVADAYNDPMFQSWLKDVKQSAEHKAKVDKAIPRSSRNVAKSEEGKKGMPVSKDWSTSIPIPEDGDVVSILEQAFSEDN